MCVLCNVQNHENQTVITIYYIYVITHNGTVNVYIGQYMLSVVADDTHFSSQFRDLSICFTFSDNHRITGLMNQIMSADHHKLIQLQLNEMNERDSGL